MIPTPKPALNIGKTLVRRLMGKKGGLRPQPVYVHPQLDKIGPQSITKKGSY